MWLGKRNSGRDYPLIRYPLKICRSPNLEFSPEREREYAGVDQAIAAMLTPDFYAWMDSDTPLFHPGRVLVTSEAIIRLGRMNVLIFLNYHVRGGWSDMDSENNLSSERVIHSDYYLNGSLCLCVSTSGNRCRTVIRMAHERLAWIRATLKQSLNADDRQSEPAGSFPSRSGGNSNGLRKFDDDEVPF